MKKYIKITEKNSKTNSVIQHFLFSVDEIEYVNVRFNNLEKNKDGKDHYYMELIMRGCLPMRVCASTDRDTVEWEFDHFRKWLTNEIVEFSEYDFYVYEDFLRGPAHAKVYSYYR